MYKESIKIFGTYDKHIQGIAMDSDRKYMYYSFTTSLVKTDMDGNVIGSVKGIVGHLGCIAYNYEDGRVYGSLEYKRDSIGAGIFKSLGMDTDFLQRDGFYVAIFDVNKITRPDMDAEKDGIMTAVYLKEVVDDYEAEGHKYGCSGIDGLTFAPIPGDRFGKKYLYVAYGIYADNERDDNDCQVILRYDTQELCKFEKSLCQNDMHTCGPEKYQSKYFALTGNTTYGIQNLEYDEYTGFMFAAVYRGKKEKFPNFPMFAFDMNVAPKNEEMITLANVGIEDKKTGIFGFEFPYGSTGMISLGEGKFYFSRDFRNDDGYGTDIGLYEFDTENGFVPVIQ